MRILIVRTSALGDVVHCLPVLTALARHLPEAEIGWVVESAMAPVLAGHPLLGKLLTVGLRPWRRRPLAAATRAEATAALGELRRFRPDIALDLMGNHKGGALAAWSGARRRIGLARTLRREPSSAVWLTDDVERAGPHAVERALAVVEEGLGLPREPPDFGGDLLLPTARPAPAERPYCLLHPGAGWGNKTYPSAAWAEVARRLAAAGLEVRVALSPSPAERAAAAAIVSGASGGGGTSSTVQPVEAGDLASLAALSRGARLVLGGDTGPIHLAHALGVPVLCLMGPTDPARHGPYGAPERALAEVLPCSFCYRRFADTKACLLRLTPRRVAERALELVDGDRRGAALSRSPAPPAR